MKMRLSSKEQEDLIKGNLLFVHYVVKTLGFCPSHFYYQDLVSLGNIGLVKAAITYDETKCNTFLTYAQICIKNEIFIGLRKENHHAYNVSIDAFCTTDDYMPSLEDNSIDEDFNLTENTIDKEVFIQLVNIILNTLEPLDKIIMLYYLAGETQLNIHKLVNLSQSCVSKHERKSFKKVKVCFDNSEKFLQKFKFEILDNTYKFSFPIKEIKNFHKFVVNVNKILSDPAVKIGYNKQVVVILPPESSESFSLVAKIFKEIYNFPLLT